MHTIRLDDIGFGIDGDFRRRTVVHHVGLLDRTRAYSDSNSRAYSDSNSRAYSDSGLRTDILYLSDWE